MPATLAIEDVITKHVRKDGATGCWVWTGARNPCGYGELSFQGKHWRAHRLMYVTFVGSIPARASLDHLCRNRACCNPEHLEPVSHAENVARGAARAEFTGMCRNGLHPLDSYVVEGGKRRCGPCIRERERKRNRLITQAANLLGMSNDAYRAEYGSSIKVAEDFLNLRGGESDD